MISQKLASLAELDTIYGLVDLYDLAEILLVDGRNRQIQAEWNRR